MEQLRLERLKNADLEARLGALEEENIRLSTRDGVLRCQLDLALKVRDGV